MIVAKYVFITCLFFVLFTASDPYFGPTTVSPEIKSDVKERTWQHNHLKVFLNDQENRVGEAFKIDEFYYPNVYFWFSIYTQYDSSSVVIHDRNDLSIVYKVLDFSSLHQKNLSRNTAYILQNKLANEKLDNLKGDFRDLEMNPFSLSPEAKRIYRMLRLAQVEIPVSRADRVDFFKRLRKNLRSQTGQRNFIRDGVMRSLPYQKFLSKYFEDKKLPKELLAIPFLESSFNPRAHSRANALGVWQFMPLIASYYVPRRTTEYDYRANVGVSSLSASFLLKENIRILKSWDLAVTAYNSGTKHLLKTKRSLASTSVNLEDIIKYSDSAHFGFASKNFYSEFLALAHTLAYREEIFNDLHEHDRPDVDDELLFFMTKCALKLNKVLNPAELDDLLFHNHHIKKVQNNVPRGFLLTTKSVLPKKNFYQISYKDLLKLKPKDWNKLLRNQSCSTR